MKAPIIYNINKSGKISINQGRDYVTVKDLDDDAVMKVLHHITGYNSKYINSPGAKESPRDFVQNYCNSHFSIYGKHLIVCYGN